ncbi:hypothetical protein [Micrococcus endophyticus]|uniref:DUF4352 domain-containing protein n=1 Tax=Micrococcus endophyticus TaxID=455343 RepID=A0A4Y8ZJ04_9MICC|nr:hypothetical protein [Micrococcus endophyticus]MBB5848777.1 hypothetical protein [Micrococcus endophyticus]TFI50355.1 hypothetical protein E4A41_02540 [Micrococcus endophyticus]
MQKNTSTLSRRKVTAGLAWSVPAVAAVSAAPAFAASPICPNVGEVGEVVKFPGNNPNDIKHAYGFWVTVKNDTQETVTLTPSTVTVTFDKKTRKPFTGTSSLYNDYPTKKGVVPLTEDQLTLAPGEELTIFYVINNTGNSADDSGCIEGTIGVELVGAPQTSGQMCDSVPVPKVCFEGTPPAE